MGFEQCEHCQWWFPEPGLAEAFRGAQECINCGLDRKLNEDERRETFENFEQRLHIAERDIERIRGEAI